ncbi:hypothetical protein HJ526_02790 [Donghicola sp. C2-DW-16]|uniref:Flagellar FliJ protein n=1 Tax=Donghicola mangrovi TaxID=2729614 RepID=A0A850PZB0_9RHOB|nr:hypothetical protein [Donghicola mangrovi]NVO22074.1 hypothetical protein [Donghicola mangrovi]NVO26335.1 hypothetical protein [Donghicola mangrovi]
MTRKEKLMNLMVRKEKAKLGQESKQLGQIAQAAARTEAQSTQLKTLLDEAITQRASINSKAQLASTMWFGNAIAQQLTNVEAQRTQNEARLAEARSRVAQAEQRVRIYGEKAVETKREARAEADAKEDSRLGERGRTPR